jgi:hypothetical protein
MRYMKLNRQDRQSLVGRLAGMPDFLEFTFGELDPAAAAKRGHHGEPSPVEQCWHLADLEREGYGVRIRRLLEETNPTLPDFDGHQIALERDYRARPLQDAILAFREARTANLTALRQLEAGDWLREGVQEGVGPVALCDIPSMMDQHDESHRTEIESWVRERR